MLAAVTKRSMPRPPESLPSPERNGMFSSRDLGQPCGWPCVDCGFLTFNYCVAGLRADYLHCCGSLLFHQDCFPPTFRTPLCIPCRKRYGSCRFCRGELSCTPRRTSIHWEDVEEERAVWKLQFSKDSIPERNPHVHHDENSNSIRTVIRIIGDRDSRLLHIYMDGWRACVWSNIVEKALSEWDKARTAKKHAVQNLFGLRYYSRRRPQWTSALSKEVAWQFFNGGWDDTSDSDS